MVSDKCWRGASIGNYTDRTINIVKLAFLHAFRSKSIVIWHVIFAKTFLHSTAEDALYSLCFD